MRSNVIGCKSLCHCVIAANVHVPHVELCAAFNDITLMCPGLVMLRSCCLVRI
jgi:hypothetical protein